MSPDPSRDTIYLDYAAGSPLEPALLRELAELYRRYAGNPSGLHSVARQARQALQQARDALARRLGARAEQLVFTSGGTEANFLAIRGLVAGRTGRVLLGPLEHPSVVQAAYGLAGVEVQFLPCDGQGVVTPESIARAVDDGTLLVSVSMASNEVGTVQDIAALRAAAGKVPFHCDAVQAVAKMPLDFADLGVDALTFSGHKFGAPKGVGGCLFRRPETVAPVMPGGGQEAGLRGGTQNLVGVLAMQRALERFVDAPAGLADWLRQQLKRRFPEVLFTGHPCRRLPDLVSLIWPGIRGEAMVLGLDAQGVAVSTGSACSYESQEVSAALSRMGFTPAEARCSLRISLGRCSERSKLEALLSALTGVVDSLRQRAC